MKKLFYLLFISSVVLASCTKEVICDCTGAGGSTNVVVGSSNFSCDTSLVGFWEGTSTTSDYTYTYYISEGGNGYFAETNTTGSTYNYTGYYSCTDGFLSFIETAESSICFTGTYNITGNIMTFQVSNGWGTGIYTLTKQ